MLHRCDVRDGEGWRGADRTDEARKRHENHGNRGSSWIAALGQHACRQSPRSSAGTAMLRLLHDRGQAGEFDRRSRLRQRSTRRGVAQGRHRDDRAASQQQKQAAHARSATAKPLYATLARGALLCLDSMAAPHPRPLGILRPQLPRLRTARLPRCPLQAILREVLFIPASPPRYSRMPRLFLAPKNFSESPSPTLFLNRPFLDCRGGTGFRGDFPFAEPVRNVPAFPPSVPRNLALEFIFVVTGALLGCPA